MCSVADPPGIADHDNVPQPTARALCAREAQLMRFAAAVIGARLVSVPDDKPILLDLQRWVLAQDKQPVADAESIIVGPHGAGASAALLAKSLTASSHKSRNDEGRHGALHRIVSIKCRGGC